MTSAPLSVDIGFLLPILPVSDGSSRSDAPWGGCRFQGGEHLGSPLRRAGSRFSFPIGAEYERADPRRAATDVLDEGLPTFAEVRRGSFLSARSHAPVFAGGVMHPETGVAGNHLHQRKVTHD